MSDYLKLKVGDKVRCLRASSYSDVKPGQVVTVTGDTNPGGLFQIGHLGWRFGTSEYWELVEPAKEPTQPKPLSELSDQELVDKINKGQLVKAELAKRAVKVESQRILNGRCTGAFMSHAIDDGYFQFRLVPKPAFEPFTVGAGWKVELKGDRLHVGCKNFDAKQVLEALRCLTLGVATVYSIKGFSLFASRTSVGNDTRKILWADADQILAELEKAGVK